MSEQLELIEFKSTGLGAYFGGSPPEQYCDSLDDVPKLSGPVMFRSAVLVLPPWDYGIIAAAYNAANWRWSMNTAEIAEYWRLRVKPSDQWERYRKEHEHGTIPSADRIRTEVEEALVEIRAAGDYVLTGGYIVFRSISGKLGLVLDSQIGMHYKAIKDQQAK